MRFAGEMQEILVDVTVLSFFVFLFLVLNWKRRDDRLRCWIAGWSCIVVHFAAVLFDPATPRWQNVQGCLSVDALAIAGLFFAIATMISSEGQRGAFRMFVPLAVITVLCLNVAIVGEHDLWELIALVTIRQGMAIVVAWRPRKGRTGIEMSIGALCVATGLWMVVGILSGHQDVVISALLGEIYLVVAIDFWANGWERTLAMKIMTAGLIAWGAVFPVSYIMAALWPQLAIDREVWNVPKFCVAVGMILVLIEEDTRAARALGDDYQLLFEANPEPFWITEIATLRFLAVNKAALDLHGYAREEFLKLRVPDIVHSDVQESAIRNIRSTESKKYRASRHVRKDGSIVALDVSAQEILFQGRECRFVMALDVTERERLKERLQHQTGHDSLTGLPNRMLLPDLLANAVGHALGTGEKLAVLSIDIDRFKRVNDVYGLRIGDECIERVAALFTSRMRSMDIVARTGGDEFTVVATGLKSKAAAEQAVHDLMEACAQPLIVQGYKIELPVSIGLAVGPDDGEDSLALWRGAERARGEAKAAGGRRAEWFSAELRRAAEEQVELEAYLRTRMDEGGLHLAYQPIYGEEGTVSSMEALLRLDHPEIGVVNPSKLIPIAEAAGLIIPLGEWVIEETCRQLLIWKSQGMTLVPVAVNVSGLQIVHVDFAGRLMATLERYAIDPRLMHVEVTESVAMRNVADVTEQMKTLSARGIEFSIDDFGTGHSSLARLSQLGASILKIDRSFMTAGSTDSTHTIVQAIITMAHTLGHKVVAEGVETEAQLAGLRKLNCDLFQGFLLSQPVSPDRIPALMGVVHPAFESGPEVREGAVQESLRIVARARA